MHDEEARPVLVNGDERQMPIHLLGVGKRPRLQGRPSSACDRVKRRSVAHQDLVRQEAPRRPARAARGSRAGAQPRIVFPGERSMQGQGLGLRDEPREWSERVDSITNRVLCASGKIAGVEGARERSRSPRRRVLAHCRPGAGRGPCRFADCHAETAWISRLTRPTFGTSPKTDASSSSVWVAVSGFRVRVLLWLASTPEHALRSNSRSRRLPRRAAAGDSPGSRAVQANALDGSSTCSTSSTATSSGCSLLTGEHPANERLLALRALQARAHELLKPGSTLRAVRCFVSRTVQSSDTDPYGICAPRRGLRQQPNELLGERARYREITPTDLGRRTKDGGAQDLRRERAGVEHPRAADARRADDQQALPATCPRERTPHLRAQLGRDIVPAGTIAGAVR